VDEDPARRAVKPTRVLLVLAVVCFPLAFAVKGAVGVALVVLAYALAVTAAIVWLAATRPPPGQRRSPPARMTLGLFVWLAAGAGLGIAELGQWLFHR
jgi:hypothetical protein